MSCWSRSVPIRLVGTLGAAKFQFETLARLATQQTDIMDRMGNEIGVVKKLKQCAVDPETLKLTSTREIETLQLENLSQAGPGVD